MPVTTIVKRTVKARVPRESAVQHSRNKSKIMKQMVRVAKATIARQAETKFVSVRQDLSFNSSISSAGECYAITPALTQGVDDYQRIGDKVRGRYLYLKGHLQYNTAFISTPAVNNYVPPSTVRVLILSQKNIKTNGQISTTADVAHLLKDNVATGVGRSYTGGMTDNLAPINKDLFKVHLDRKVKMKAIYQNDAGTGGASGWVGLPTMYFSCRIKLPATLYFDDQNGDNPNNFAPFFCLGGVNDDGTSPYAIQQPYRVSWLSTLYYDDA